MSEKIEKLIISGPSIGAEFTFSFREKWVMKINDLGIFFNHDAFPEWKENEFAMGVLSILEECEYVMKR